MVDRCRGLVRGLYKGPNHLNNIQWGLIFVKQDINRSFFAISRCFWNRTFLWRRKCSVPGLKWLGSYLFCLKLSSFWLMYQRLNWHYGTIFQMKKLCLCLDKDPDLPSRKYKYKCGLRVFIILWIVKLESFPYAV